MLHHRILSTLVVSTVALACERPPTAPGGPDPAPNLLVNASAGGAASVSIKSEHLTGVLPNGLAVDINLKADAEGTDPSSLTGNGRHFASTGAHNYWPATGSMDGTTVTLAGTVTESNVPFLIGSPVVVVADASTEAITLSFGPLAGGPFAGQTLLFTGVGKVIIN